MSETAPAISVRDVHFSYNGNLALKGVSLDVEAGAFVSIIGPNGSGKTTLLRLVSGVMRPASGRVSIFGRDVARMGRRELARLIAFVPQATSVAFAFTVEEVVLMGRFAHLGAYGFEGARDVEVARNAMRATEVEHLRARSILELSGGETQRVIIARALAQEARILLLDEPTAFLDIKHQVEITSLVKNLQTENGLTVISISHDLNLAAAFSQHLLLLKEGSVFASGSPDEVIREEILSEAYDTSVRVRHLDEGRIVAPRFKV